MSSLRAASDGTVSQTMQGLQVTFCIDTNLLVEFTALESIPWRELAPLADSVRIIIPTKVGEEMDEHKNKSGRLRRRAIEFSQLSRRMEDSADGMVILRAENPRVTVEFGPLFRKSDLDGDIFELEDSDNRIVAEAAAIARDIPGLTLLADDSKPIRLARQAGLAFMRPPAGWRRQEGPDERDVEIGELRREIGAQPKLTIALPNAIDAQNRHLIVKSPEATDPACSNAFRLAVQQIDPEVSREELVRKHGYYSPSRFDMPIGLGRAPGLTDSQLSGYENSYNGFSEKVRRISEGLPRAFSTYGTALPFLILAGNEGDRAAERVHVEAELSGPFHFLPTDIVAKIMKAFLDVPKPPKRQEDFLASQLRHMPPFQREEERRADLFYDQDEPTEAGNETYISWRCEELRHGAAYELPILVAADSDDGSGVLTVTISSAVIAKKTVLRAPLSVVEAPAQASRDFFLQRLSHIPRRYREAFRALLEQI